MAEIVDLRQFDRAAGDGVVAQLGNEFVEVINISVAGVRLARPRLDLTQRNIEFRIIPCLGAELDFHRAIPVCGHIVGSGSDHLRIAFAAVTRALANIIGRYDQTPEARRHDIVVPAAALDSGLAQPGGVGVP